MLNAAIVGCGWVSDWHVADGLAHLPERFRVLACCDTNPQRLDAFAVRYGTERKVSDYDAVLAMYHDQGLPVLKYAGFGRAVNVTLGLPIIRTSVDHGTAYDLAGSGRADAGSLRAAVALAVEMARAGR